MELVGCYQLQTIIYKTYKGKVDRELTKTKDKGSLNTHIHKCLFVLAFEQ